MKGNGTWETQGCNSTEIRLSTYYIASSHVSLRKFLCPRYLKSQEFHPRQQQGVRGEEADSPLITLLLKSRFHVKLSNSKVAQCIYLQRHRLTDVFVCNSSLLMCSMTSTHRFLFLFFFTFWSFINKNIPPIWRRNSKVKKSELKIY